MNRSFRFVLALGLMVRLAVTEASPSIQISPQQPNNQTQTNVEEPNSGGKWSFSLAYGHMENPLFSADQIELKPLPVFQYDHPDFYFQKSTFGIKLLETHDHYFDLIFHPNWDSLFFNWNKNDSNLMELMATPTPFGPPPSKAEIFKSYLPNLGEREMSFLAGFTLQQSLDWFDFSVRYSHDISGIHNGSETEIKISKQFDFKPFSVAIDLGNLYRNSAFNNYYYGIEKKDLAVEFLEFANEFEILPNEGSISFHKIAANIPISEAFFFNIGYSQFTFGTNLSESPLVEKDSYRVVATSVGFRW